MLHTVKGNASMYTEELNLLTCVDDGLFAFKDRRDLIRGSRIMNDAIMT